MRKLHKLLMAALVLVPLAACDEGDNSVTPDPVVGTVSGTVAVEGTGLAGVTVALAGASSQSTTTGANGGYTFTNVVEGNYSVTLSSIPEGVVFSQTSQSVSISSSGATATADFNGQYVRTASILVSVTAGGDGVATSVRLQGAGVDQTLGTNSNGQVQFSGLRAGSYTVSLPNPPEGFDITTQEIQLATGQSAQVNFTGEGEVAPAEISIQSITQGGGPISLGNVMGQIEVTLNIDRADETLDRVEVLIGGEVVAQQTFAQADLEEGPAGAPVLITLNVPTTQLRMSSTGEAWVPVLTNGGKNVSANLFVVERETPTPSNEVPIVLQNPDAIIAPLDGVLTFDMEDGSASVTGSDGKTWRNMGANFTGPMYISYTTKTPTSVVWPTTASAGIACSTGSQATSTVTGDADSGYRLSVYYSCATASGTGIAPNAAAAPSVTVTPAGPGPDGTAVVTPTGFSGLGAQFMLDGETRRFLLTPAPTGALTLTSSRNIDNVAPEVFVACEYAVDGDGDPTTECDVGKPLNGEQVAYNDLFDERWINASYDFSDDVAADDSAGAAVGVGLDMVGASHYVSGACSMTFLTNGDDLPVTNASDGTPDGHRVCGIASDLLGNTATSEAPSNWFGVDKMAPMVRMGGEGADALIGTSPLDGGTGEPVADTLGNNVSTIYNIGGEFDATMVWALEALDDRAGFNENAVDSFPVQQWITRQTATLDSSWLSPNYAFTSVLSDTWRRSAEEPFLGSFDMTPGTEDEGYYAYQGYIYDRAGNMGEFFFNWMVDQTDEATVSGVSFGSTFYEPASDAPFNLFGSDDLEVISAEMGLIYPTALGAQTLVVGQFNLDSYMRWDGVMPDPYDASLITRNSIGDQVTIPGANVYGRLDFTCSGAAAPYASCAAIDEVPADTAEFNVGGSAASMLATGVDAGLIDAGMNLPTTTTTANFLAGQWTDSTATPWGAAEITSWAVTLNGSTYEAVHQTNTSVTAPFFDAVVLVVNDGAGRIYVCGGTFTYAGSTDNGIDRFYNYTKAAPAAGTRCGDLIAGGGVTVHAVGVEGSALLATQGI